jgi:hypothetical protein
MALAVDLLRRALTRQAQRRRVRCQSGGIPSVSPTMSGGCPGPVHLHGPPPARPGKALKPAQSRRSVQESVSMFNEMPSVDAHADTVVAAPVGGNMAHQACIRRSDLTGHRPVQLLVMRAMVLMRLPSKHLLTCLIDHFCFLEVEHAGDDLQIVLDPVMYLLQ